MSTTSQPSHPVEKAPPTPTAIITTTASTPRCFEAHAKSIISLTVTAELIAALIFILLQPDSNDAFKNSTSGRALVGLIQGSFAALILITLLLKLPWHALF